MRAKSSSSKRSSKPEINSVSMSTQTGMSMDVRKIENGYVTRHSGYVGSKKNPVYKSKETFSKTSPVRMSGAAIKGMKFSGKK